MRLSTWATASSFTILTSACILEKEGAVTSGVQDSGATNAETGEPWNETAEATGFAEEGGVEAGCTGGQPEVPQCVGPLFDDWGTDVPALHRVEIYPDWSHHAGTCGGDEASEYTSAWTAPHRGTYLIRAHSETFDAALHVYDGECGPLLTCVGTQPEQAAEVVTSLEEGQTVFIVVDGSEEDSAGPASVWIREAPSAASACGQRHFPTHLPATVAVDAALAINQRASECGGAHTPELAWTFSSPRDGIYTFDTLGSSVGTILSVRDGGCSGPEVGCVLSQPQSPSVFSISLRADEEITLVVEALSTPGTLVLTGAVDSG